MNDYGASNMGGGYNPNQGLGAGGYGYGANTGMGGFGGDQGGYGAYNAGYGANQQNMGGFGGNSGMGGGYGANAGMNAYSGYGGEQTNAYNPQASMQGGAYAGGYGVQQQQQSTTQVKTPFDF